MTSGAMSFYRYFWSVHRSWVQHIVLPTHWTNCSICRAVNPICTAVQYYWYSCTSVPILLGLVVRYWADTGTGTCIEYSCTYSCTCTTVQLYNCTLLQYSCTQVPAPTTSSREVQLYSCTAVQLYSCRAVLKIRNFGSGSMAEIVLRISASNLLEISVHHVCNVCTCETSCTVLFDLTDTTFYKWHR